MNIQELNEKLAKILEEAKPQSPIADKYGGCEKVYYGKIGKYSTQEVWLSGQVKEFLIEVSEDGGVGTVTSIMRFGKTPEVDKLNPRHHNSGNKFDLKMDDIKFTSVAEYDKQVIQRIVPILKHPACKELAFECFGNNNAESVQIAERITKKIYEWYPNIKRNDLIIHTNWGWQHSSFRHVDVCINPENLKTKPNRY